MVKISGTPIVEGYTNTGARRVRVSLWADSEDEISGVVTGEGRAIRASQSRRRKK